MLVRAELERAGMESDILMGVRYHHRWDCHEALWHVDMMPIQ